MVIGLTIPNAHCTLYVCLAPRLSLPSILVNPRVPGAATRASYATQQRDHALAQARKRQDENHVRGGRRRERRRENGV